MMLRLKEHIKKTYKDAIPQKYGAETVGDPVCSQD